MDVQRCEDVKPDPEELKKFWVQSVEHNDARSLKNLQKKCCCQEAGEVSNHRQFEEHN